MRTRIVSVLVCIAILFTTLADGSVFAASMEKTETPQYKVAFYAFDNYHMQDENGRRYGYGYEMMQDLANYMQCTFSYVGYDKTAAECVEMLRAGEIDLYTAAKITPERKKEFAVSVHPAITAMTCMNVKAGNKKVVAGDYSTYNGLKIGLLRRHTYNEKFLEFAKQKGFDCEIVYYETPTSLSNALINGKVDALVNSYIRIPEDEQTVEDFGQTPYYIMARKEDQALIDQIDKAFDRLSIESPNWRVELYNEYYGAQEKNTNLTIEEKRLLQSLKKNRVTIKGVMNPDRNPYSWYEDDQAEGIAADIFRATAKKLGVAYEIVSVKNQEEYQNVLSNGDVDIWMDLTGYYEDEGVTKYKLTGSYLSSTMSVLRSRASTGKHDKIAILEDNISMREIITSAWPDAEIVSLETTEQCVQQLVSGNVDGILLMTYMAQKLSKDDVQNRLSVDIVPGASMELRMGVNAEDSYTFYGLWEKTLTEVVNSMQAEIVQEYVEDTVTPTAMQYLFDHPSFLILTFLSFLLLIFFVILYVLSAKNKRKQEKISKELAEALADAREANEAKQNFFSKMSHDIRTPLNVVLGMTQMARRYSDDEDKLEHALENIEAEGDYLLTLINSILDVNQLEHGYVELINEPFQPSACLAECISVLSPLATDKEQIISSKYKNEDKVVVGDGNRLKQIIVNIVSNAIKYTATGGKIQVSMECSEDNRCAFVCEDNGIGMTPEFVEHIFEEYVRAEDSRVSKVQGTGLGMSVVKGFTELMGGKLDIKSQPGEGTIFRVEIPFKAANQEQILSVLYPISEKTNILNVIRGKHVLMAEDNALNAEISIEMLQSIGLKVDWVENGKLCVDKFLDSEPGTYFAIFMDMQMPVMDGIQATKEIRGSKHADSSIPIIAMTANTFDSDRNACREAGMNGYISKPIHIQKIESTLNRILHCETPDMGV